MRVRFLLGAVFFAIAERTDVQRVVFYELKRTHDFDARVSPTGREFTLWLALPSDEMLSTEASD